MVTITRRVFNVISSRTFHRARRRQLAGDSSTAPRSLHTSDSRRGRKKVLVPRVVAEMGLPLGRWSERGGRSRAVHQSRS